MDSAIAAERRAEGSRHLGHSSSRRGRCRLGGRQGTLAGTRCGRHATGIGTEAIGGKSLGGFLGNKLLGGLTMGGSEMLRMASAAQAAASRQTREQDITGQAATAMRNAFVQTDTAPEWRRSASS